MKNSIFYLQQFGGFQSFFQKFNSEPICKKVNSSHAIIFSYQTSFVSTSLFWYANFSMATFLDVCGKYHTNSQRV